MRAALGEMERRFPGLPLVARRLLVRLRHGAARRRRRPRVRAPRSRSGFPLGWSGRVVPERVPRPARCSCRASTTSSARPDRLRAVVERLPEPPTLVVIPGADHFFTGQLDELEEAIASWAAARPWNAAGRLRRRQ